MENRNLKHIKRSFQDFVQAFSKVENGALNLIIRK